MSITFSGLTTYGKVTLPSIEGGLGTMKIVKDPPKSIHTRKIDKVGDSNQLLDDIDCGSDRACEAIKLFARGVDPMKCVNYSNAGVSSGQGSCVSGNFGKTIGKGSGGKLPVRIMNDGAFRPPIMTQEQLMPLSRQPRLATSCITNPEAIDYSIRNTCNEDYKRAVKQEVIQTNIRPTAIYRVEKPIKQHFTANYILDDPLKVCGYAGTRTLDWSQQEVLVPRAHIVNDNLQHSVQSSVSTNLMYVDNQRNLQQQDMYINNNAQCTNFLINPHGYDMEGSFSIDERAHILENPIVAENVYANINGETTFNGDVSIDTAQYTHNISQYETDSKRLYEQNVESVDIMADNSKMSMGLKDQQNIHAQTNVEGFTKTEYIHKPKQLETKTVLGSASTNSCKMGADTFMNSTRNARSRNKPQLGGFTMNGSIPRMNAIDSSAPTAGGIDNTKSKFTNSLRGFHDDRF